MVDPQPQQRYAQDALKTVKWLLLCIFGTVMSMFLNIFSGSLLAYPAYSIVLSTKFWLHDRFPNSISLWSTPVKVTSGWFAGTDTYVEDLLAFGITSLYFGIVFALISSKSRRQKYVAIGLIAVYSMGVCWLFLSAIARMT